MDISIRLPQVKEPRLRKVKFSWVTFKRRQSLELGLSDLTLSAFSMAVLTSLILYKRSGGLT